MINDFSIYKTHFKMNKKEYVLKCRLEDDIVTHCSLYYKNKKIKTKTKTSSRVVLIPDNLNFVIKVSELDSSISNYENQNIQEFKKYKKIKPKDKRYFAKSYKLITLEKFNILIQEKIKGVYSTRCFEIGHPQCNRFMQIRDRYNIYDIHDENILRTKGTHKIIDYAC